MDDQTHTTQTLRQTLFDTIEGVIDGSISEKKAAQVASLAGQIVKTADLEMRFTDHVAKVDARTERFQQAEPGPMLLSGRTDDHRADQPGPMLLSRGRTPRQKDIA